MKRAYIITKEGRAFNRDGIDRVLNIIRTIIKYEGEIEICQGQIFNEKEALYNMIHKHPEDNYIFVSYNNLYAIYNQKDIEKTINNLKEPECENMTTWEMLTDMIDHTEKK